MRATHFHPIVAGWFSRRFPEPTDAQRLGWPAIADRQHALIAAPTGSGKTLAAFLTCIDRLLRQSLEGNLADEVQVVYVSPLKALSNDIRRNLERPLAEILGDAREAGFDPSEIRAQVRTGDTPSHVRQAMLRRPPHILVTTPESLYILLTTAKGRERLRHVRTVIVDEIHALARDKRGSHLTLTLERLEALCASPPQRIGLSATQRPMDRIARFLVGTRKVTGDGTPACHIVDVGHVRAMDLAVEVPPTPLSAVCSHEMWAEIYTRLCGLIASHRSTLIFVNTRRMAERVAHQLAERIGADAVASHHGSLSREIRLSAEERLKTGNLKAIVATASLELGIDIGYIDLVCQIGSPRSIATFLQRVGRAGHSLGATPKGRLFALTREELIECLALIRAVNARRLDAVEIPEAPLDILAQQIVAAAAAEEWEEDALFELARGAWPFRDLTRNDFDAVIGMLSEGIAAGNRSGAYLHRDRINGRIRGRRGARMAAVTSGGAIPENAEYRVVTSENRTFVGTVNEDFAIESLAGDVFILGNTSWRIRHVRGGEVVVDDAKGAPATIPFWLGEAPGRTIELSAEVSALREELARRIDVNALTECEDIASLPPPVPRGRAGVEACRENNPAYNEDIREQEAIPEVVPTQTCTTAGASTPPNGRHGGRPLQENAGPPQIAIPNALQPTIHWLRDECRAGDWPALQAAHYIAVQKAAVGMIPTQQQVLFERFFDESGGMQLVIHAPFGARINRAWGLALRKRFCRTFDFELQASADDNGIVLSVGPQNSFPIEAMFKMLGRHNGRELLVQALLAVPMFQVRWRWNTTRALMVLRQRGGRKVPPPLQRFRADDLLTAVFPQQTQCFEHRTGDLEVPDHPLARQTVHDCLHEAMDLDRWLEVLDAIDTGAIQLIGKDTREPSPFSYELLNAYPYAFLDDAPLEERRARAVATRRTLNIEDMRDLGRLDPAAIARVRADAWPVVRDADELHDALLSMAVLPALEGAQWTGFLRDLIAHGRAVELRLPGGSVLWLAAERWPLVRAAYPQAEVEPLPALPPALLLEHSASEAAVAIIRGRLESTGPQTTVGLAQALSLPPAAVEGALETLESQGLVLRGRFTPEPSEARSDCVEWCDRRLLARIHRLTLDSLRQRIQPVEPRDFWRFLIEHQHAAVSTQLAGAAGALQVIRQLEGFELPAGAWEHAILPARLKNYDPAWLDQLSHSGQVAWGRLQPPRQAEDVAPGGSIMTRVVPISLLAREDLGWLLPPEREDARRLARSSALAVLDALGSYGAMFIHDLPAATGLLPTQVEDALSELSALGLVTADGFAAIRTLVSPNRRQVERTRRQLRRRLARPRLASRGGRWSRFPGWTDAVSPEQRVERWARLLLDRYGVIFRDLLANETVAPAWSELAPLYRRMEARGEIRGGRFVSGVGGEQFALPYAVEVLRRIRDTTPTDDWLALSAADPLNLTGILLPGPRIPATRSNAILLRDGRLVAGRLGRQPVFYEDADLSSQERMARMLRTVGVHIPMTPVTKDPPVFTA